MQNIFLKLKPRGKIRLSTKRILIATGGFCLLLAFSLIVIINVSDWRDARAAVNGDYRSIATGDWNDIATWQKFNGTSWIAATAIPSSGDGVIEIQNGHIVTIN